MKILFIGDPHIRHTHLQAGIKLLRWIECTIEEVNPDLVVNLGDTFDTHAVIRSEALSEVRKHIDRVCKDLKKPMVMVLGNHDMWKPSDPTYHALQAFNGLYNNLHIVDKTTRIEGIDFVPYLHNALDWPKDTAPIAVTHNTFLGADYGNRTASDGISIDGLSADIIISGHIHKRQEMASGRILYPGAPMALSATDANQDKGLLLFESSTYQKNYINSPFPIWRTITISPDLSELEAINTTDHWVVTVRGLRAEVRAFVASDKVSELRKATSMTFKTEYLDSEKTTKVSINTSSIDGMVDQFMESVYKGSEDKGIVKETVKKALLGTLR